MKTKFLKTLTLISEKEFNEIINENETFTLEDVILFAKHFLKSEEYMFIHDRFINECVNIWSDLRNKEYFIFKVRDEYYIREHIKGTLKSYCYRINMNDV